MLANNRKIEKNRLVAQKAFLENVLCKTKDVEFLAGDCSFRTYFSLEDLAGVPCVLMDAPPGLEDVRPFMHVQKILLDLGCAVPIIHKSDVENGFLLLEDFGRHTYTKILQPENEKELYALAVDVLIHIHQNYTVNTGDLLPLKWDDYRRELGIFLDWYYVSVFHEECPAAVLATFYDEWHQVLTSLPDVPLSVVLRDYHVDNMMFLEGREGVQKCGLLDFQDARFGPTPYDLVSLLEDARRDISPILQQEMLDRYFTAFPEISPKTFMNVYTILGAQRSVKILGIFARMAKRAKDDRYLVHIPRVWKWIEQDFENPQLAPIKEWFNTHIPMEKRHV